MLITLKQNHYTSASSYVGIYYLNRNNECTYILGSIEFLKNSKVITYITSYSIFDAIILFEYGDSPEFYPKMRIKINLSKLTDDIILYKQINNYITTV